jgi:uncharacterized protein (DUF1501 family)
MYRRYFLQHASLGSAAAFVALGTHGWALRTEAANRHSKRLVVVFLRGAVDGLNVVVPYQEAAYYQARPRIAIPQPGKAEGALNLDGNFGLHPALASLLPLWHNESLAFVHACGSSDAMRSHFDAQDYMETGTPGTKRTRDGWMNRLLTVLPKPSTPRAVSIGPVTPRILTGWAAVMNLPSGNRPTRSLPLDRPEVASAFDRLYTGDDPLSQSFREGQQSRQELKQALDTEMQMANRGAALPNAAARDLQRLARLMVNDSRVQLGFMAIGGWDTHVNQGSSQGQLATRLRFLGDGLALFAQELGPLYKDTITLVMSEFGRTVQENGNGGTDHGHGNVVWAMGEAVKGRQIYGKWPGLSSSQRYEGRDLAVTTDFRAVIATILVNHLHLNSSQVSQVLPGYPTANPLPII